MVLPAKCLHVLGHRAANGQEALLLRLGSIQLGARFLLLWARRVKIFVVSFSPCLVSGVVGLPLWSLPERLLQLPRAGLRHASNFISHRISLRRSSPRLAV